MRTYAVLCLSLVLLLAARPVTAVPFHDDGQSYVYFRIYDDAVEVRLELTVEDLNETLGLSMPTGKGVEREAVRRGVAQHMDAIQAYIDDHFTLQSPQGGALGLALVEWDLLRLRRFGDFLRLTYAVEDLQDIPEAFLVEFTAIFDVRPGHRNLVHVEHHWKSSTFNNESNVAFILSPSEPRQRLDLSRSTVWTGFRGMIGFGIEHILIGFDHILFLLALVLPSVLFRKEDEWAPAPRFRGAMMNIVTIVTFFTIAHTITLSLAALQIFTLPSTLVEAVIAASIAVAALHNLYPRYVRLEGAIAFVFGLFHGFGFASLLEPLGLGREYTVLTLLGFNAGVEIGQVIIIVAIFPVLYLLRRRGWYRRLVLQVGSVVLIGVALLWFVERTLNPPALVATKRLVKDIVRPVYSGMIGFFS